MIRIVTFLSTCFRFQLAHLNATHLCVHTRVMLIGKVLGGCHWPVPGDWEVPHPFFCSGRGLGFCSPQCQMIAFLNCFAIWWVLVGIGHGGSFNWCVGKTLPKGGEGNERFFPYCFGGRAPHGFDWQSFCFEWQVLGKFWAVLFGKDPGGFGGPRFRLGRIGTVFIGQVSRAWKVSPYVFFQGRNLASLRVQNFK